MVAGCARDVAIATQDLVEEQGASQCHHGGVLGCHRTNGNQAILPKVLAKLRVETQSRYAVFKGSTLRVCDSFAAAHAQEQSEANAKPRAFHGRLLFAQRMGREMEIWCVITLTSSSVSGPLGAARMLVPIAASSTAGPRRKFCAIPGRPVP